MEPVLRDDVKYTVKDIEKLPEGKRAELVDGEMYMMATPSRKHQRVLGELYSAVRDYIKKKGGKCEVNFAPFAVYLFNDELNYFEPDLTVVCNPEKLDEKGCHGAPDWVIEITSPSTRQMDYMVKLFKYERAGVREYWIVDIEKGHVRVYDFSHSVTEEYNLNEIVKVGLYEDLEIDFREIMKAIE